jgi:hypothetical protein
MFTKTAAWNTSLKFTSGKRYAPVTAGRYFRISPTSRTGYYMEEINEAGELLNRICTVADQAAAAEWLADLEAAAQPVHAGTGDGRMVCNGTYGGPAVNPKYDAGRITCPDCAAALAR